MTIFVTVGFSATFSVILYIVFAPLCWLFLFLRKTRLYALSGITDAALTGDKMTLSIIIVYKRESKSIFFVYVVTNLNDDTGKARKSEAF